MRKIRNTLVLLALAAASLVTPITANAAPLEQCAIGAWRQHDMAGLYVSAESQMRLEIYPCGGSYLEWQNAYGLHYATYATRGRLDGGGVVALPMDGFQRLDNTPAIGIKPSTPGYIEIWTVTQFSELIGVYRLRKIS